MEQLKIRIQIASLIGFLGSQEHKIYPFLVIVPNSTITNWVREFEKWVPHLRVVSYSDLFAACQLMKGTILWTNLLWVYHRSPELGADL